MALGSWWNAAPEPRGPISSLKPKFGRDKAEKYHVRTRYRTVGVDHAIISIRHCGSGVGVSERSNVGQNDVEGSVPPVVWALGAEHREEVILERVGHLNTLKRACHQWIGGEQAGNFIYLFICSGTSHGVYGVAWSCKNEFETVQK